MLQLKNICKTYLTGDLMQKALDDVSVSFRDSEFAAILGPSGSGKTTLLNIVGGLDRYDSGDLIINSISTSQYTEKDWDSYRNHAIGFVFQNYSLISHQTLLSNVEMALTLSGVSSRERKERAAAALEQVELKEQMHKLPNQLSGGQMQRVAIARALVNDPDIILADEPTGALDSKTSVQVMDLLKSMAKDRLVIMVTHNPELAKDYATRIIHLQDGKIISDSNPYIPEKHAYMAVHQNMGKSSMSFKTALSLSFHNLMSQKRRTAMTAFAGSIGITGIAMILALSSGLNSYIEEEQKSTMLAYPIMIEATTMDLNTSSGSSGNSGSSSSSGSSASQTTRDLDQIYMSSPSSSSKRGGSGGAGSSLSPVYNDLSAFKTYLESDGNAISSYAGSEGIQYEYDLQFDTYVLDADGRLVSTTTGLLEETDTSPKKTSGSSSLTNISRTSSLLEEMPADEDGLTGQSIKDNYDLICGTWPSDASDVVLILNKNNELSAANLYRLGFLSKEQYDEISSQTSSDDSSDNNTQAEEEILSWSYEDALDKTIYLAAQSDYYIEQENGTYIYTGDSYETIKAGLDTLYPLHISGIIRPKTDAENASLSGTIGYTELLNNEIICRIENSGVITAQLENPETNILTGQAFEAADDAQKEAAAISWMENLALEDKASLANAMLSYLTSQASSDIVHIVVEPDEEDDINIADYDTDSFVNGSLREEFSGYLSGLEGMPSSDLDSLQEAASQLQTTQEEQTEYTEEELATLLDEKLAEGMDADVLLQIYDAYLSEGSYEENLEDFGYVSLDSPSSILIYADTFEAKEAISKGIETYNSQVSEEEQITYTDYTGLLLSSITTIINTISGVLIAFVGLSLVVSSIMIGIVTYISVMERTKEIGILRAVGASRRNIAEVFDAQTLMIGLLSGLIGVGMTYLLCIPMNAIIHSVLGVEDMNAFLPVPTALLLIVLSMALTFIGGLIPARSASKKEPAIALRTE